MDNPFNPDPMRGIPPCCSNCGFHFSEDRYYSDCPKCGHTSVIFL